MYIILEQKAGFGETPWINQLDYLQYSGICGPTSLCMLGSAALGYYYTPEDLFNDYYERTGTSLTKYHRNNEGYGNGLLKDPVVQELLHIKYEDTYNWGEAWGNKNQEGKLMQTLEEGKRVIWCTRKNMFTTSGHYMALELVKENGRIWINDPNGGNYPADEKSLERFLNAENPLTMALYYGMKPEELKKFNGAFYVFSADNTNSVPADNDTIINDILTKVSGDTEKNLLTSLKSNTSEESTNNEWLWPVESIRISSKFGRRNISDEFEGTGQTPSSNHGGVDVGYVSSDSIVAAKGGTVILAQMNGSAGKEVRIDHGDGYVTRYLHCSSLEVKKGDIVEAGDLIAITGNTGTSSGEHLHFEVQYNGQKIDPLSLKYSNYDIGNSGGATTSSAPTKPTISTKPELPNTKNQNTTDTTATATKPTVSTRTRTTKPKKNNGDIFSKDITYNNGYEYSSDVMPYTYLKPSSANSGNPKPLIVWLHGGGKKGVKTYSESNYNLTHIISTSELSNFDAYVISPILTKNDSSNSWWCNEKAAKNVADLIDKFAAENNVDKNNIVIMGGSEGGRGAQYMAATMPEYFSQTVVLSGYPVYGVKGSDIEIPVKGYVGGWDDENSINYMKGLANEIGEENVITVEGATHNKLPKTLYNLDSDGNGKSDFIEALFPNNTVAETTPTEPVTEPTEETTTLTESTTSKPTTDTPVTPTNPTRTTTKPTTPTEPTTTKPTTDTPVTPTNPTRTTIKPTTPTEPTTTKPTTDTPVTPTTPTRTRTTTKPTTKPTITPEPTTDEKPKEQTKPIKPIKPSEPSIPSIIEPDYTEIPVMQCTPEAVLKAAKNVEITENDIEYICNILHSSGYFTEEEINMYKNWDINEICKLLDERGWDKITNISDLKNGDIIIVNNGKEIRVYAGNNSWYTAGESGIQQGNENWAENTNWFAYRPD